MLDSTEIEALKYRILGDILPNGDRSRAFRDTFSVSALGCMVLPRFNGQFVIGVGLTPVHMTLPGYDSSIGGSDEQPEIHAGIQG